MNKKHFLTSFFSTKFIFCGYQNIAVLLATHILCVFSNQQERRRIIKEKKLWVLRHNKKFHKINFLCHYNYNKWLSFYHSIATEYDNVWRFFSLRCLLLSTVLWNIIKFAFMINEVVLLIFFALFIFFLLQLETSCGQLVFCGGF